MDVTPLQYLENPQEMTASASASPVFLLLIIFIMISFIFIWFFRKFIAPLFSFIHYEKKYPAEIAVLFFLLIILFVPIRGGIQKIPINHSDVYFSEKLFADHAALNLPWNLTHSVLNAHSNSNPFQYFSEEKADSLVNTLQNNGSTYPQRILSTNRPNIILIIMESLTAKLTGFAGGEKGVTPNLDKIAKEGLAFTNIYAAGDRSEKGQVAIFSGYPNQAITSIIKTPTKTQGLPSLNRILQKAGYYTSFTYGGELEFANIKSYLLNTGYENLVSKYSFPLAERTTSWGVHDHFVFQKFYSDLQKTPQPFFATLFTLSSHEPFDVPMHPHFKGNDETVLFKNAVYYTDSTIGNFINKIKQEKWWDNTLVILVADHGHPLPGNDENDKPSKFHIPLIFYGGALKIKGTYAKTGSQTDIASTLLHQLDLPTQDFIWSRNLLDSSTSNFAFYCFNNGFGFMTDSSQVTVDNASGKVIYHLPLLDSAAVEMGKAYMQASYGDFLLR